MILNVTNFTLFNIGFKNCNKNHSAYLHTTFDYGHISISEPSHNASIFLYHCTSIVISNITVLVTAGTTGLLIVNVKSYSTLTNVSITSNHTICPAKYQSIEQTSGIVIYCDYWNKNRAKILLDNFQFLANESCASPLQYVITLLLPQSNTEIFIIIKNTNFKDLRNVSALYYYGETCGVHARNLLVFVNCIISNNTGKPGFLQLFQINLCNQKCFKHKVAADFSIMQLILQTVHLIIITTSLQ